MATDCAFTPTPEAAKKRVQFTAQLLQLLPERTGARSVPRIP